MKTLFSFLLVLVISATAHGQGKNYQPRVAFTNSLEQPIVINQGFEGVGYENASSESWTGGNGNNTQDPDFATPFGLGSDCLKVISGNIVQAYWLGGNSTNKSHLYGYGRFIFQKATAQNEFLWAYTNNAQSCFLRLTASGTILVSDFTFAGNATTASAVTTNTITHLWWEWDTSAGTGNVGFSTTGTKPSGGGTYASYTGGSTTGAAALMNRIGFEMPAATSTNFVDKFKVSLSPIGDNGD